MDFDAREIDECLSSESDREEEKKEPQLIPAQMNKIKSDDDFEFGDSPNKKNGVGSQQVILPFKPGKRDNNLNKIPQSAQEIKKLVPLYQKSRRELPL